MGVWFPVTNSLFGENELVTYHTPIKLYVSLATRYLDTTGLYTSNTILFCATVVVPISTLPVVRMSPGAESVNCITNACVPVTGGVTVATSVVPVTNVKNVFGAIVVALANVTGINCP